MIEQQALPVRIVDALTGVIEMYRVQFDASVEARV